MTTHKGSFAGKVLAAAKSLGTKQGTFSPKEISHEMGLQTGKAEKKMGCSLRDLLKAEKLERVEFGIYQIPKLKPAREPEKQEVMWRIARARRSFTVNDLVEMAGVTENYAREWCQMLVHNSVAKKTADSTYLITSTDVDLPRNERKSARLKRIRANKKVLLNGLDKAQAAVLEANTALGHARKAVHELEID